MSRSFGARSFTTWSPIRSSPSLMSSSPAIIRSAVDFPHPDGPTRITNSPSWMSRFIRLTASVPSPYRLVTSFSWISATNPSSRYPESYPTSERTKRGGSGRPPPVPSSELPVPSSQLLALRGCCELLVPAFHELLHELRVERRDVIRLAAGDEALVHVDLL